MLPEDIEQYYLRGRESARLAEQRGELERLRTQTILARELPPPPAVILDVGGAAGVYAFPLAEQGYKVHLIDPVELHLEQARSASHAAAAGLASITRGEAGQLDFPSASADAVLLLGPLYHLVEETDRQRALREAWRVLKPGGVVVAAAISRFASLIDGLSSDFFQDARFRAIVAADLSSGQHRNPGNHPEFFTTAYFHRPAELEAEVCAAGFGEARALAVEGPAWNAVRFREVWADPAQRKDLLEFLSRIESEASIMGASAHLVVVARRPG